LKADDLAKLIGQLKEELATRPAGVKVAIVGRTPTALDIISFLTSTSTSACFLGIYAEGGASAGNVSDVGPKALGRLTEDAPDIVIIAEDTQKEPLLEAVAGILDPSVRILIGGYGHFVFRDDLFNETVRNLYIPSFANGYPNSLIHIYQCLRNSARQGLKGVVAEFGMFKGGTTMLISQFIEGLGADWKVLGFDTFGGFPARRSVLDMYAHPDCVFLDEALVRRCFEGRNVEIVVGDVVETAGRLADEDLVLAFVDTDNYSSAARILEVITDRVVLGGAIVFDHFTGRDRHLYTIGERIAAKRLLDDPRYFNLHDTGVFLRVQ
jgi:hypothetical protein